MGFDATFGLESIDPVTLHGSGEVLTVASRPAVSTFDDSAPTRYWSDKDPSGSVKVAGLGTRIEVLTQSTGVSMNLRITSPPSQ
jgi:immune inhibitor A